MHLCTPDDWKAFYKPMSNLKKKIDAIQYSKTMMCLDREDILKRAIDWNKIGILTSKGKNTSLEIGFKPCTPVIHDAAKPNQPCTIEDKS